MEQLVHTPRENHAELLTLQCRVQWDPKVVLLLLCRYTIKACTLFTVRYFLYQKKKWGFYMLEFCKFFSPVTPCLVQLCAPVPCYQDDA